MQLLAHRCTYRVKQEAREALKHVSYLDQDYICFRSPTAVMVSEVKQQSIWVPCLMVRRETSILQLIMALDKACQTVRRIVVNKRDNALVVHRRCTHRSRGTRGM